MTPTLRHRLPHGIELSCHVSGPPGRPVLLFLHGFPEGAFAWDALLSHFAAPEHGAYRCVAPNLRGFADSSAPSEVSAYRAKHLMQDVLALIDAEAGNQPLAALVAHDWGGALAWNLAAQCPQLLRRLLIINSPANPTGGVTPKAEIDKLVAGLEKWPDVCVMSDEIYDHMVYDGEKHVCLLSYPSIRDRLIRTGPCKWRRKTRRAI